MDFIYNKFILTLARSPPQQNVLFCSYTGIPLSPFSIFVGVNMTTSLRLDRFPFATLNMAPHLHGLAHYTHSNKRELGDIREKTTPN